MEMGLSTGTGSGRSTVIISDELGNEDSHFASSSMALLRSRLQVALHNGLGEITPEVPWVNSSKILTKLSIE